jgi:hypothetical protein
MFVMITNRKSVVAKFKSNFTEWPYEWVKEFVGAFLKNNQEMCLIDATHLKAFTRFSEMSKYFTNCSTNINQYASSYMLSNIYLKIFKLNLLLVGYCKYYAIGFT